MVRKALAAAALLALAAAPLAWAHEPPGPDDACNPVANPHDYAGAFDAIVDLGSTGEEGVYVRPHVEDGSDCSGTLGPSTTSDGDREFGAGVGFFPAGRWADDDLCDYGLTPHHGSFFHAFSSAPVGAPVPFVVGSDGTRPQLVPSADPTDDDGWDCFTDGVIAPGVDATDCLQAFASAGQTSCPPGADGGWWVWIACAARTTGEGVSLDTDPPGASVQPPEDAEAHCSLAGHVQTW